VGVIIPLLKDKEGDCNSIDNYRGITLCPVISKLFELVIIDSYSHMLTTDDLQFGFKPNLSCDSAIFTWRTTVDHFVEHGSSVFVASLDVSKAFDTVSHTKLIDFLAKKGIPHWLLCLLNDWYSKLVGTVRWLNQLSYSFPITNGVRQGSSLSPSIFSVFVDTFILDLKALDKGCTISDKFLGCIMYADDLILLSASVSGLQAMLDCCYETSQLLSLKFNNIKSHCFVVGPLHDANIRCMRVGNDVIEWRTYIKYLGIMFSSGKKLHVNTDPVKHKFFRAFNSIYGNCRSLNELVHLKLHESYCLPLLSYGSAAVKLTTCQLADMNSCWNIGVSLVFANMTPFVCLLLALEDWILLIYVC